MNLLFGRLMTLWALYRLSGPGVVVIWLALIGWFIEGSFGWISLGAYIALLIALAFIAMHAVIELINRNSKFLGNKPIDLD